MIFADVEKLATTSRRLSEFVRNTRSRNRIGLRKMSEVTVTLSDDEQEALRDFLPRVQVANVCVPGTPLHTALLKVSPKSLPWDLR